MDWTKFNNHGESSNHAFEVMCNILFKYWFKKEYKDNISHFAFINGSGGDGGVEAYGLLTYWCSIKVVSTENGSISIYTN